MNKLIFIFSAFIILILGQGNAQAALPKKAIKANASAPIGGTFIRNLRAEPPSLHPITSTDIYSSYVKVLVLDSLLDRSPNDYEWIPRLAEKWEISKDGMEFTFTLRKGALFHDGKPVTTEDVKFSFDAIFEPKYEAAHLIPYFEGIDKEKTKIIDSQTIKFFAKNRYFKNFDSIATMYVVPKHLYADVEKSKKMNNVLVGSGPYVLDKFERGQRLVLKRNDKWTASQEKVWQGAYNYQTIDFKFIKDENIEIERIKKGDLDFIDLSAESFVKKTEGDIWGKSVFKSKVENSAPKSYRFIGWNLRKDLFKDRDLRIALAHLMNRAEMNKKFRYGMSDLATGPTYLKSEYANHKVKPIEFDPKKAQGLLSKAGWKDSDKDGVLDKIIEGKTVPFKFSLIYANKDNEKYWTMYKEDLKKAGIEMELKYMEWNSFLKVLDEGNFEAVTLGWGGGDIDWDPKQIWHSASAIVGGSNFIHYKNPEVDKLIDEARETIDRKERMNKLHKVYEIIASDAPYVFLFNDKYGFYANSSRVEMPGETFEYEVGINYWWAKKQ